jgi:hypothetical protein
MLGAEVPVLVTTMRSPLERIVAPHAQSHFPIHR